MASRKKRDGDKPGSLGAGEKAGDSINRPFAKALRDFKIRGRSHGKTEAVSRTRPEKREVKPAARSVTQSAGEEEAINSSPISSYGYEDRAAYLQAYADVQPLRSRAEESPQRRAAPPDSGSMGTDEASDDEARANLAQLLSRGLRFRATLDLHGYRRDEARRGLVQFVREERRSGRRVVRIIHGKGRHSEGGTGVLADLVVEVLTSEALGFAILAFRSEQSGASRPAAIIARLSDPVTGR